VREVSVKQTVLAPGRDSIRNKLVFASLATVAMSFTAVGIVPMMGAPAALADGGCPAFDSPVGVAHVGGAAYLVCEARGTGELYLIEM
jgi:hypothetical protein